MENLKMQSLFPCNKRTGRYRPGNKQVSCTSYNAENGYLGKFEAVENHGSAFEPRQCLYQKVAVGTENPKMQSLFGAINALGVTIRQINRFLAFRIGTRIDIWENSNLSKAMVPHLHQSNVYTKR